MGNACLISSTVVGSFTWGFLIIIIKAPVVLVRSVCSPYKTWSVQPSHFWPVREAAYSLGVEARGSLCFCLGGGGGGRV